MPGHGRNVQVKFLYGQFHGANVALLFNPRFESSAHIVFNSLVEGKWGTEERMDNSPLRKGKSFTLMFTANAKEYKVTVNEHHHYKFRHRLPPARVRFLEVDGDVKLEAVNWKGGGSYSTRYAEMPGRGASRAFQVDFLCGGDRKGEIALHVNPRFEEGMDEVIFNSFLSNEGGKVEEECYSHFCKGKDFQLGFVLTKNCFKGAEAVKQIDIFKDSNTSSATSPGSSYGVSGGDVGGTHNMQAVK
ncbi:galectin-4-like [Emydura macquarii macquarii]|uniref:galectin-4-like n=1 Tax=Emydura macquarii macquarii TaxID=1129001 RepID=UPI003529E588